MTSPLLYIIAGCNGAGKTTASATVFPDILKCREFVNADEIARGLSPFNPSEMAIQAGMLMVKRIDSLFDHLRTFAVETTLASRSYAQLIKRARKLGYRIRLIYIWLASADQAIKRVACRVSEGGHNIPRDTIVRRYDAGLRNLREIYMPLVDSWCIFDNSQGQQSLVASDGVIYNPETYEHIINRHIDEA